MDSKYSYFYCNKYLIANKIICVNYYLLYVELLSNKSVKQIEFNLKLSAL